MVYIFVNNGGTIDLPVTSDPEQPPTLGRLTQGYVVITIPGINGVYPGSANLNRQEVPLPLIADTVKAYSWTVHKGPIHIVKNGREELCTASLRIGNVTTITNGSSGALPDTEQENLHGAFSDGYDVAIQPATGLPFEGPFVFELSSAGQFSPATVPLEDMEVGLQFEIPEEPCFTPPSLSCIPNVRLPVGDSCQTELLPEMVLEGGPGSLGYDAFMVVVEDSLPGNGPIIDGLGSYRYGVSLIGGPQEGIEFTGCWGMVIVESPEVPVVVCKDITVNIGANGLAVIDSEAIFDEAASDNCGPFSLSVDRKTVSCEEIAAENVMDYALQLDGENDYILVPDSSMFAALGELTLGAWIKLDEDAPGNAYTAMQGNSRASARTVYMLGVGGN